MWAGFVWHITACNGGLGLHKELGMSWLAERLLVSREVLCSMELVLKQQVKERACQFSSNYGLSMPSLPRIMFSLIAPSVAGFSRQSKSFVSKYAVTTNTSHAVVGLECTNYGSVIETRPIRSLLRSSHCILFSLLELQRS
jgi:hypothetical protein